MEASTGFQFDPGGTEDIDAVKERKTPACKVSNKSSASPTIQVKLRPYSILDVILEETSDWSDSNPSDFSDSDSGPLVMPTCRLCLEKSTRPVILSCGHVFCYCCIHTAYTWKNQTCPRCHAPHLTNAEDMQEYMLRYRASYHSWRRSNSCSNNGSRSSLYGLHKVRCTISV